MVTRPYNKSMSLRTLADNDSRTMHLLHQKKIEVLIYALGEKSLSAKVPRPKSTTQCFCENKASI